MGLSQETNDETSDLRSVLWACEKVNLLTCLLEQVKLII